MTDTNEMREFLSSQVEWSADDRFNRFLDWCGEACGEDDEVIISSMDQDTRSQIYKDIKDVNWYRVTDNWVEKITHLVVNDYPEMC